MALYILKDKVSGRQHAGRVRALHGGTRSRTLRTLVYPWLLAGLAGGRGGFTPRTPQRGRTGLHQLTGTSSWSLAGTGGAFDSSLPSLAGSLARLDADTQVTAGFAGTFPRRPAAAADCRRPRHPGAGEGQRRGDQRLSQGDTCALRWRRASGDTSAAPLPPPDIFQLGVKSLICY